MKRDILYYSSIPWDYAWHRQQELAVKLAARGCRILFLQPPSKAAPLREEWSQPRENIWCYTPPGLPYERCLSGVHYYNARRGRQAALQKAATLSFTDPLIWTDRPHGFDRAYYRKQGYDIYYDLVDDTLGFGRWRNKPLLTALENRLLQEATLVIASSRTLLERKLTQSGRTGETLFLPNGVDTRRFAAAAPPAAAAPVISFVGTIAHRSIDYRLVQACAALRPRWTFRFTGPGTPRDKQALVADCSNILVEDAVPGNAIPALLAQCTAGWIPYHTQSSAMDYAFPRKAMEYLAAGKPVVSVPLPEVLLLEKETGGVLRTGRTPEEMVAALDAALASPQAEACRTAATRYDWDVLLQGLPEGPKK